VYDNQSNLSQTVDARGNSSFFCYNGKFQLIGSTNAMGNWVTNFYNATDGTLSTRTDAGGTTTYGSDVEAKFGSSGLTSAQRLADQLLPNYEVDRFTYSWLSRSGTALGTTFGYGAASQSGDK